LSARGEVNDVLRHMKQLGLEDRRLAASAVRSRDHPTAASKSWPRRGQTAFLALRPFRRRLFC